MVGGRRGAATFTLVTLPDLTAPVSKYSVTLDRLEATVTEELLRDDVSAKDEIVREVDWGLGDGFERWDSGTTAGHTYPELGIWYPKLRLRPWPAPRDALLADRGHGDETEPNGTDTMLLRRPGGSRRG